MGLWVPHGFRDFTWRASSVSASRPTGVPGALVTIPATDNVKGTYVEVLSAANMARDALAIVVSFFDQAIAGGTNSALWDVAIDPSGGTSYSVLLPNLLGSCSGSLASAGPVSYAFPIFIKAGSSVAVRLQTGNSSGAGNFCNAIATVFGEPREPSRVWCGTTCQDFGTNTTNSRGTAITAGTTSEGAYATVATSLGADYDYWQAGFDINDSTMTNGNVYSVDLAYGDATNKHLIIQDELFIVANGNEVLTKNGRQGARRAPGGANLYMRAQCSGAADSTLTGAAYGVR